MKQKISFSDLGFNFVYTYLKLDSNFYSLEKPYVASNPKLLLFNETLAKELALKISKISKEKLASLFSGKSISQEMKPYSQAYAGHQFGHFTMLGDGRAIILGEHKGAESNELYDVQLKGSGITKYSRNGDGKGPLKPMIREYIISEALYYLGVPSTRSLCVVETGDLVYREKPEKGAILTRISKSHIRFGTFEFACYTQSIEKYRKFYSYVLERSFSHILDRKDSEFLFFEEVMLKQIKLVIEWSRIGFIHGVMNTDNMSVLGEAIDFGPCAFMDTYDPKTVYSYIDIQGRYSFENQSKILKWNLARFAETLIPLLKDRYEESFIIEKFNKILSSFDEIYDEMWLNMMRSKLGLKLSYEVDKKLITDFLELLYLEKLDYTNSFRSLTYILENKSQQVLCSERTSNWIVEWKKRINLENQSLKNIIRTLNTSNPVIIPRNHLVEKILDELEKGFYSLYDDFYSNLTDPYSEPTNSLFSTPPLEKEKIKNTFCGT